MVETIRIGTRGSPLALTQANMVRDAIIAHDAGMNVVIEPILTSGDWCAKNGEKRLPTKALFATEIEEALLSKEIDFAVHSMKDMDSIDPDGLVIDHVLKRADVRDCLILSQSLVSQGVVKSIHDLPDACMVGTASVRREKMIKSIRPDIKTSVLRGNVHTRIEKVKAGQCDATFLAMAGLSRLGIADIADVIIGANDMIPAACQGTIGIQTRADDDRYVRILQAISCQETLLCTRTERAVLKTIKGSCDTPIGVYARFVGENEMRTDVHLLGENSETLYKKNHQEGVDSIHSAENFGSMIGERIFPYV